MINLLSHDDLRQLRASRLNIILRRYVMLLGLLAIFVAISFGGGYFLLMQERQAAEIASERTANERAKYNEDIAKAKAYTSNLATAKAILSNEVLLSDVTFQIAKTLPAGSIVQNLDLSTADLSKPITLEILTTSFDNSVAIKDAFENSTYFENAIISTVTSIEDPESKYSTSLSLTVMVKTAEFTGVQQ